jgi:hypothetical protein
MASKLPSAGTKVAEVKVQIGPQFLNLFSEHLYSSPNKAFEELVSNSWDAGARRVFIRVPEDLEDDSAAIWVLDDGGSMDTAGFQTLWSVATSDKRDRDVGGARQPIGKFGVGKLATYLLAHELTYICRASDQVKRIITMDYRLIDRGGKGKLHIDPIPLGVRELNDFQLRGLLEALPNGSELLKLIDEKLPGPEVDPEYVDEFGGGYGGLPKSAGTWTLAVLSSLKEPGRKLQAGRIRRMLRAALPLGNTITIFFNDELLSSAKSSTDVSYEGILGPGLNMGPLILPTGEEIKVEEKASPYPHLRLQDVGEVSGRVKLYSNRISGGKSETIEVSNGFFVNIRGRVLKPEDPYFGLENLSHSVWAKFRATVRADSLDNWLAVNRESLSECREVSIFKALLMKLFNLARSLHDSSMAGSWPDRR